MAKRGDYKKITDLFVPGAVILPSEDSPPVWIQKLNAFEVEEARAHANARRALIIQALRTPGSDAMAVLRNAADRMTRDQLLEGVVAASYSKHMAEAANAVGADPEWLEKQSVIDRIDPNDPTLDDDQRKVLTEFNTEYFRRVREGIEERDLALRAELDVKGDPALREDYIEAYIDSRGTGVFTRENRVAEIVAGARMCDAPMDESGSRDYEGAHASCTHERLFIDEPVTDDNGRPAVNADGSPRVVTAYEQVRALPDELFAAYTQAFDRVNVARHVAKGSASRRNSSASSRPQNEAGDSTASTPEEAPTTADGT